MELLDKFAETVDRVHTSFITQSRLDIVSHRNYRMKGWGYLNGTKTQSNLSCSGSYDIKAKADIELLFIVVDPDHDALGSFNLDDIPNKTYCALGPGIFYWKDGEAVPDEEYQKWRKNNPIP